MKTMRASRTLTARRRGALALLAGITALAGAGGAAAAAGGETLLVLHKWSASLGAYDPSTGQRRGTVPVGTVPHEMVLSADGRQLYVADYGVRLYTDQGPGANAVVILGLAASPGHRAGDKLGEIPLGEHRRPHGIEIGRSGKLYVTCDQPPSVLILDPGTRQVVDALAIDQKLPHMLAVTKDERSIFVANSGSASITVLHPSARTAGAAAPRSASAPQVIDVGGIPMGVALSPDDRRLYVANRDGNAVVVVDVAAPRPSVLRKIDLPGAPARVAVVPGKPWLVVTLIEAGDAALIDTVAWRVTARTHVGGRAEGLMVDRRGRYAYVSAQADDKLVKLALPELRSVLGVATDQRPDPSVIVSGRLSFGDAGAR